MKFEAPTEPEKEIMEQQLNTDTTTTRCALCEKNIDNEDLDFTTVIEDGPICAACLERSRQIVACDNKRRGTFQSDSVPILELAWGTTSSDSSICGSCWEDLTKLKDAPVLKVGLNGFCIAEICEFCAVDKGDSPITPGPQSDWYLKKLQS